MGGGDSSQTRGKRWHVDSQASHGHRADTVVPLSVVLKHMLVPSADVLRVKSSLSGGARGSELEIQQHYNSCLKACRTREWL